MSTNRTASRLSQLIDMVGAGSSDPGDRGPIVVKIDLWDGRVVQAKYYRGGKDPDIVDNHDVIWDSVALGVLVKRLLGEGKTFISETGTHDMVCTLEWSLVSKAA